MSEEIQGKRGDAAWKEQREAIQQRNAAVRRKAQATQKTRESAVDSRIRAQSEREREQLHALNARIGKQRERRLG